MRWETSTTHWRLALTALRQFTAREGTCRPREGHVEALVDFEVNLYTWCRQQRHAHRCGQLDPARGATLETGPTWVLLDELVELGRPKTWLARELGRGSSLQLSRLEVTVQAAADVAALHERIGSRRPPRQALPTLVGLDAAQPAARSEQAS